MAILDFHRTGRPDVQTRLVVLKEPSPSDQARSPDRVWST